MTDIERDKLLSKISTIPGGLSKAEACALFEMAKLVPSNQAIVEIGSWKGRSTICLALGSKTGNSARVYAIDPHTGSPDHLRRGQFVWTFNTFRENVSIAGVSDVIEPILLTGEKVAKLWDKKTALVFVDAQYHSLQLTTELCLAWLKILSLGGTLALHNTMPALVGILEGHPLHGCEPVTQFMRCYIYNSDIYKVTGIAGTISFIQKNSPSFLNRLVNFYRYLESRIIYGVYYCYRIFTKTPIPIKKLFKKIIFSR